MTPPTKNGGGVQVLTEPLMATASDACQAAARAVRRSVRCLAGDFTTLRLVAGPVIAIKAGTKNQPRGKWKGFQTKPADELQLQKWFANGSNNMAVLLVPCRVGWSVMTLTRWKPTGVGSDLSRIGKDAPYGQDRAGCTSTFRTTPENLRFVDLRTIDPPEDGEYRGDSGHYCLLPRAGTRTAPPTLGWFPRRRRDSVCCRRVARLVYFQAM